MEPRCLPMAFRFFWSTGSLQIYTEAVKILNWTARISQSQAENSWEAREVWIW